MSAQTRRQALYIFLATILILIFLAIISFFYARAYPDRPLGEPGRKITVEIPRGAALPQVISRLQESGLLKSTSAFRLFVNYKGQAANIRAGTYTMESNVTPRYLLQVLVHGVAAPQVTVTIPEGKNMLEVAQILAEAKVAPAAALIKEMRNKVLLQRLSINGDSLEGYLFPDTYKFKTNSKPQEVLERMVAMHKKVYFELAGKYKASLKRLRQQLRWDQQEIITLASIVEKETGQKHERPLIAGVFLNRLLFPNFSPKLLQTDPTIIYGCTVPEEKSKACQKFDGRIRRIHLDDQENIYSTYAHEGLPPGPIASPGRAAIEAVFNPTKSRFLYFVSKNDGTHQFSATKAEHEAAVNRYQR